jgi:hypothetical protein
MPRKKDEERSEILSEIANMLGAKENYQVIYRDGQLLVRVAYEPTEGDFYPASYFWVWCTRARPEDGGQRPLRSGGHGVIPTYEEDAPALSEAVQEIMKRAGKMGPSE